MNRLLRGLLLIVCLLPCTAMADQAATVKETHREAAQRYLDSLSAGVKLSGSVDQNGSAGTFDAYFFGEESLVRESFGSLISVNYSNADGSWSGSNFSLPYQTDPTDSPASASMELISSGKYLDEPYWSQFNFVSEDAGSFSFRFTPDGLPSVDVVLYADPDEPQYGQIMSCEVAFCSADPDSIRYRSYYYYETDAQGRIYTKRETGREVDQNGETVNFSDYQVDKIEQLSARPDEMNFDTARKPVGALSAALTAPLEIPANTANGYFIVPVTFSGSAKVYKFMLDTGASVTLLTKEAATAAQLTFDMETTGHGHGSRAKLGIGLCSTASLGEPGAAIAPLAGFPATQIPETNKDLLDALASYGTAGILGVAVLHQYVVKFDHSAGKLLLIPPQLFKADTDIPRPNIEIWLDVEDLIFCKGTLDAGSGNTLAGDIVIDTGLQQDLSILRETLDINSIKLEKISERTNTVLGGLKKFDYVNVPGFEIGPLRMENKTASVTDDDRGSYSARGLLGFIGITLFQDGPITLDLFNQRMYIEPPENLGYFPGLTPGPDDKKAEESTAPEETPKETEKEDGKTQLPIDIGAIPSRLAG